MLICIVYLLMCLGVEVVIVSSIIDRLADRDYLFSACFVLFFLVVCLLMIIAIFATIC